MGKQTKNVFLHVFSVSVDIWKSLVEQMFGTNNLNQICFLLYQILTKRMLVGICLQTIWSDHCDLFTFPFELIIFFLKEFRPTCELVKVLD